MGSRDRAGKHVEACLVRRAVAAQPAGVRPRKVEPLPQSAGLPGQSVDPVQEAGSTDLRGPTQAFWEVETSQLG